jgi:Domain of unknown function (DUF4954)
MSIPTDHLLGRVNLAFARSELLRAQRAVRQDGGRRLALGDDPMRPLTPEEIDRLRQGGNDAADWSRVLVVDGFDPARVSGCSFLGEVVLGRFAGAVPAGAGVELPSGVYRSTLKDCVVGHHALVRDVRLLAGYVVGPGAVLLDCGRVTCEAGSTFGNGTRLALGPETGGRPVAVFAELDVEVAWAVARAAGRGDFALAYAATVGEYAFKATAPRGVIESGARVLGTPRVQNTYLGPFARVDGATLLADSTLLSSAEEPARAESGACVRHALLQRGTSVRTLAVVENALLTEHSSVERHGKVANSILGPNTAVGGGEVTSCLLGPFVACHHQSLLIATLWPGGQGNVGYGANVGSNHTSRAPDQEFRPGEGMFFGLGVNVKFPADFSRAPYTVVACGTNLLPQKMTFPFSLIATPSAQHPGVSPAYMEVFPGWVLGENLYGLRRNEAKYRSRNKARRTHFEFAPLRPETVDLMRDACRRLEAVAQSKAVYTEADVEGLGKNYLTEQSRRRAVEAYRFFVRYYALLGLCKRAAAADARPDGPLLHAPGRDPCWEHQRQLLVGELGVRDVASGLRELPGLLEQVARQVEESRARDDRRGERILDDYAGAHPPAREDGCVRQVWEETWGLEAQAEALASRWRGAGDAPWGVGPLARPLPVGAAGQAREDL